MVCYPPALDTRLERRLGRFLSACSLDWRGAQVLRINRAWAGVFLALLGIVGAGEDAVALEHLPYCGIGVPGGPIRPVVTKKRPRPRSPGLTRACGGRESPEKTLYRAPCILIFVRNNDFLRWSGVRQTDRSLVFEDRSTVRAASPLPNRRLGSLA